MPGMGHLAKRCYSPLLNARITIEPGKRSGQPCIRGLRITVWDVLKWLAAGMTEDEILDDYPELEREDFRAVYEYADSAPQGLSNVHVNVGMHDIAIINRHARRLNREAQDTLGYQSIVPSER